LRSWIFGLCTLLSAGAAQGAGLSEPYARVGDWEITAEDKQQCMMSQLFGSTVADEIQSLGIVYDGQREGVALSWASNKPKFLLPSGSLALDLAFMKGSSSNESWGSQDFQYKKVGSTYYFTHAFMGPADVERILGDISSSEIVSLFLGPTLMMGLPLNAAGAVEKLRECSSKMTARDSRDLLQK
jgi:hypothetical protein